MVAKDELREEMLAFALRVLKGESTEGEVAILPQIIEVMLGTYF